MTDITAQRLASDVPSPMEAIADERAVRRARGAARNAAAWAFEAADDAVERGKAGIATLIGLPELFPGARRG